MTVHFEGHSCKKCGIFKQLEDFTIENRGGVSYRRKVCKKCRSVNKRTSKLLRRYNLSQEDYNVILFKQGSLCACCGCSEESLKNSLCVDHDHSTGKVRGLLCGNCNAGIGLLKDDPVVLDKAATYLRSHGKT